MSAFVSLDNVSHAYGGKSDGLAGGTIAIEELSLAIEEGEFVAVVGPSGCGKSTLMKLATGLQFPFKGEVRVAGEKVTKPVKIAGMAFQAPTLLPWRTTLENLLLPLEIVQPHRREIWRKRVEYAARAKNLLTSVGLRDQGDKYPWELSGGMQQRTSLCRALIHEPRLLMLDEPFGALDAFTREELWCVIRDLQAARKITVILVTHDLREAVFLADRVFVMSARPGRIVAERRIELPRPRDLEVTFTQGFQDIVHELRAHIVKARQ
jgi:NitT/TauT family transport system ATP-binding protein